MTSMRGPDERLRDAFQAMDDGADVELSEVDRERIWLAVTGTLPAAEREDLVDRMAAEPAVAEAWRVAHALWEASHTAADGGVEQGEAIGAPAARTSGPATVIPMRRATRWTPSWLAAAAVLLLCTSLGVFTLLNRPQGDEFRAAPPVVVESLVPADATLPRDGFRLTWKPGPEGSRYQVRVSTDDLRVLATAVDLTDAAFTVDPSALADVPAGATVFWQVDVVLPDGGRVTSPTFSVRVQ